MCKLYKPITVNFWIFNQSDKSQRKVVSPIVTFPAIATGYKWFFPPLTAVTVLCSKLWLVCSAICGNAADIQEEIVDCMFYRNNKTEIPSRFLFAISADALFLLKGHVTCK